MTAASGPPESSVPTGTDSFGRVRAAISAAPARLGKVRLVAIDGPSGSGKSVYADRLRAELGATLIRTDDFATWDDPVSWWPRLADGVLDPLANGRPGRYQRTEWINGTPHRTTYISVAVPRILLVEGVSAGRRSVGPLLSYSIWCEHPDQRERLERAVARDGEAARRYLMAWQDFENGWFAVDQTRRRADYVA